MRVSRNKLRRQWISINNVVRSNPWSKIIIHVIAYYYIISSSRSKTRTARRVRARVFDSRSTLLTWYSSLPVYTTSNRLEIRGRSLRYRVANAMNTYLSASVNHQTTRSSSIIPCVSSELLYYYTFVSFSFARR